MHIHPLRSELCCTDCTASRVTTNEQLKARITQRSGHRIRDHIVQAILHRYGIFVQLGVPRDVPIPVVCDAILMKEVGFEGVGVCALTLDRVATFTFAEHCVNDQYRFDYQQPMSVTYQTMQKANMSRA